MAARHHALTFRKVLLGVKMHTVLQNMATNGHHYSAISCLGPSLVRSFFLKAEKRCDLCLNAAQIRRYGVLGSKRHVYSRACQIIWSDVLAPERVSSKMIVLQMCALCESIGRGIHFNPYASIGRQVHGTFECTDCMHMCI